MKRLISILKEQGPMLSGELAQALQDRFNVSYSAARQIISRAKSPVHKNRNITFEKNQLFLYLDVQYNSTKYYENFYEAIKTSAKNCYCILIAMQNNGGYISKNVLASYANSPVENLKRHKRYDEIISDLLNCNFIIEIDDYYKINEIIFTDSNLKNAIAIELAKKTAIEDFKNWAKNINLVSYNQSKGFYENAIFGKFQWAFSAPSYINDIFNLSNQKPGFIIADVIVNKYVEVDDIQFFISKINIIRNYKNISKFIPFFIADGISKEALKLLKENHIVCALLGNLFSQKYAEALRELINIKKNASAIICNDFKNIEEYLEKIELMEGKMGNIIGDLFEVTVGYYFHHIGSNYFEVNKIVKYEGKEKEIDVYVERNGKIQIIECKGIKSFTDHNYVKKWLTENVPIIFKAIKSIKTQIEIEFELWSTGDYIQETKDMLEIAIKNTNKYSLAYLNSNDILKKAEETKCELLRKNVNIIKSS